MWRGPFRGGFDTVIPFGGEEKIVEVKEIFPWSAVGGRRSWRIKVGQESI
jgi:hypothetical protein